MKTIANFDFTIANNMNTDIKTGCAKKLARLLPNITSGDKNEALYELKISRPTLEKYLKGNITDVDRALQIIQFFENKVNQRVSLLKGAA